MLRARARHDTTPPARPLAPLLTTLLAVASGACHSTSQDPSALPPVPEAPRAEKLDLYHGTAVADPFRPLEDTDAPETRAWIEAENARTHAWLAGVPQRGELRGRLAELFEYERYGIPEEHGGAYYYTFNDGTMEQGVLCRVKTLDGTPEIVLDPNLLSKDGTVSLGGLSFAKDGRHVAYGLSDGGSDWRTWRVLDLATDEELPERLEWIKFTQPAWTPDGAGFFYGRYPAVDDRLESSNQDQSIYYHRVGTEQSADVLAYSDPENPRRFYWPIVTDDGRFLLLGISESSTDENRLYVREVAGRPDEWVRLFDVPDAEYSPVTNDGWLLWLKTTKDAPNGRIVKVDARAPGGALVDIVPERPQVLRNATRVGNRLFLTYLEDARDVVRMFDLAGTELGTVDLPGAGTVTGFDGERDDVETFYAYSDYTTTPAIYRYDLATSSASLYRKPKTAFDPSPYETSQVFYRSKDGTRIPMWITARKGIERDGNHPTLLYGYGGFNNALTPGYSAATAMWLEMGGVYAVANLRGGGEYGREWHEAGTLERKQNVFDDFIAAGEYLVAEEYTQSERLAILGGSNGGLLVGACLNQRPDLFGAALPAVGVMDMLRYHLFTIGWAWASDYGTSDDPKLFPVLHAYSPLHNVKPGTRYPATFITTADHDDRVVPGHSFKYAAALQEAQAGDAPILIRIETRAGHAAGKSLTQSIEETADRYAFLVRALDMRPAVP